MFEINKRQKGMPSDTAFLGLFLVIFFTFLGISISFGATYETTASGDYDDCTIWKGLCASETITANDTVVIAHGVTLHSNLKVDGVLLVGTYATVDGMYKIEISETGQLTNSGIINVVTEQPPVYYVPNSFTPNGDEINNTFSPVFTDGYDPQDYNLEIYNRRGELIFESKDSTFGWDGTHRNSSYASTGVYTWKIEFKEMMSAKRHHEVGHVNIFQ